MFHLAVYFKSLQAIGAINVQVPGVVDQGITLTQNNNYVFNQDILIRAAQANGIGMSRPRIQAPTLRRVVVPSIQPTFATALPPSIPPMTFMDEAMLGIPRMDELGTESSNTDAAAQNHYAALWIGDGNNPRTPGPTFTTRFTAAITGIANGWALGAITMEQSLPAGIYTVVGLSVVEATLIWARLQFPTQVWRPGCIGRVAESNDEKDNFRFGRFGDYGTFVNIAQPQLEIFTTTAGAKTPQGFLDLVKVG